MATILNSLAVVYDNQGKYADAEPLYKRSLAIREKSLGPDHTAVATTLNGFEAAMTYGSGKLKKKDKEMLIAYNEDDVLVVKHLVFYAERQFSNRALAAQAGTGVPES